MKCEGCGVTIQSLDKEKAGYIPQNVLDEKIIENDKILCQRCFKLKNYNHLMPFNLDSDFLPQLEEVVKDFNTIIWVIDIMDFEGTFRDEIAEKLKGKEVILLANKIDLLPKTSALSEVKEWLFKKVRNKLRIKKENIRMISAKTGFGFNKIRKIITMTEKEKALIIGVTNTGKSSVLNKISEGDATVSSYPGTTLSLIKTYLSQSNIEIYDTPGIEPDDRLYDFFDIYTQVKMVPNKNIEIGTYKLEKERVFFISSLVYFIVEERGEGDLKPIFTVFASNNISVHETNIEKIEDVMKNRDVTFPPYTDDYDFDEIEFNEQKLTIKEGYDLSIPGFGWLSVKRGPLVITIKKPKKLNIYIRKSMIKPKIR
ncbi:ribosome biogenesis GTPase YqeH [Geotoga petraea]|uniref:Ribosome biogenesis GTPase YqeH n=1 Tax=Geotoga petraea TaxID=28234 RepID=A0A4Z0VYE5_9BACT|nr:ribosome biogenesis GTPase YqeH [Geotoga petraea]TGG89128.1 ribosome biogenesis GTPase YqeH [Geotoga petraea]